MAHVPSIEHLVTLSDDTGVIQHATYSVPNRSTGYCVDDVARAFIVALQAAEHPALRAEADRLAGVYLAFLHDAQLPDGRFHNFLSYDRRWLDEAGSEDACGRAMWALGYGVRHARRDDWRTLCGVMLERALPIVGTFVHPRASAFAALGLVHARHDAPASAQIDATLDLIARGLVERFERTSGPGWEWFEDILTYDNARLCEALLRIGAARGDAQSADVGRRALKFYEAVVFEETTFVPIGNDGWYPRGGERARYDQQPLEATAMIDAELAAFALTGDATHHRYADRALAWFFGENTRGAIMVSGGGCRDGIERGGPSGNMGAESTLAYLAGALALSRRVRSGALRVS